MSLTLATHFNLDPEVVFLNHGSFGACPRPVFEAYQRWQLELERQPVAFLGRRVTELMAGARAALAEYLGVAAQEVVFFPNPTTAGNMVIRNLALQPGDEVLTTDHEYGALERTWRFYCAQTGAHYRPRTVPFPVTTPDAFVEHLWAGVTERTRVLFISHLTSPTALIFPVAELCRRARAAGILTIVDGAHVPGHLPLNLAELGADLYLGACHKWLCAPKGSAFVYARREAQPWLKPLVVSWGWEAEAPGETPFIDWHEWQGTRDPAAFLATPAAIAFQAAHDWGQVRAACHALARETRTAINALTGLAPFSPDSEMWFGQMAAAELPAEVDVAALKTRLYDDYRIEVPVFRWNGRPVVRFSFQAYNTAADGAALVAALRQLL